MRSESPFLTAFLILAVSGVARAQDDEPMPLQAQRLEHTLGHLAADYARFGRSERKEHMAMAREAERIAKGLRAPPDVAARVATVRGMLDASAPAEDVRERVDDLRRALIGAYRIEDAPPVSPSVTHGRALYEQNCASCHGPTGRADTARAASVRPHPVNFRDPLFGETLTPYEVTTTVRFGIAGTAMVPFAALGEADRWDLAFYVLGLRHPGPLAVDPPAYSLSELANRTDEALRAELSTVPLAAADVEPTVAALRRKVTYERRRRRGALALARAQIDRARVAGVRGERDEALDDVREAVTRGLRPAEAALSSVDPAVGRALGGTLAYLADRVRSGAPPAEVDAAIGMALGALTRADRALDASYARAAALHAALGASSLLAGMALLMAALRSRNRWPRALLAGVAFVGAFGDTHPAGALFAPPLASDLPPSTPRSVPPTDARHDFAS